MNDQPPKAEQPPDDPRVRFAAERTLLAWMRTGLALMGFGFVVARFGLFLREIAAAGQVAAHQHSTGWSLWIGTALIGLGVVVSLLASFEYYRFVTWSKYWRSRRILLPPVTADRQSSLCLHLAFKFMDRSQSLSCRSPE